MKYCVGEVEFHYEMIGQGKPILILNGYFNDLRAWKSSIEPIFENKPGYQRIYLDYPGTGQSKVSSSIKTWCDLFESILIFIDSMIPNQTFIIIGHSFGGFLARGILKRKFELIDGILLSCPVVNPRIKERDIDKKISSILKISEDREKYIRRRINREVVKSRKNTDKEYLKKLRANSINLKYDFDDLDKPFLKPSLFITGRQDKVVGYRDLFDILDNFPYASFVVLDNAKHDIQVEQNDIFDLLVNEWLIRVEEYQKL